MANSHLIEYRVTVLLEFVESQTLTVYAPDPKLAALKASQLAKQMLGAKTVKITNIAVPAHRPLA